MSLSTTYIIAHVQAALDHNLLAAEEVPKGTGEPVVAPESLPVFSDDIMCRMQFFKDKAIAIPDFEAWMQFLELVAGELGLNPATDFPKIASVLNRYRVDEGKEPL
jgi:hypothetical protein